MNVGRVNALLITASKITQERQLHRHLPEGFDCITVSDSGSSKKSSVNLFFLESRVENYRFLTRTKQIVVMLESEIAPMGCT